MSNSSRIWERCFVAGALAVALCWLALGPVGCGGESDPVVVRVGSASIRRSTIERWTRSLANNAGTGDEPAGTLQSAHAQALASVISSYWILGEAEARHMAPSRREVARHTQVAAPGQAAGDVALETGAELADEALRRSVLGRIRKPTPSDIAAYYSHHLEKFRVRERREVDLIEYLPSRTAAEALGRRLGTGPAFARRARRELVERPERFEVGVRWNGALLRGIFSAKLGVIGPPAEFINGGWVLPLVRRIVPGYLPRLSSVRSTIARLLSEKRQQEAIEGFTQAYQRRWTARTRCSPGFVVQKCSEFSGPKHREDPPFAP